jgi:dynein heavy chain
MLACRIRCGGLLHLHLCLQLQAKMPIPHAKTMCAVQVTTHHDAAASGVYLTLSPAGFTRFTPDGTEFLTHEQWEREYLVHMQLMQLRVFKQYRLWRPMALWRKVVRDHKSAGSSAQLQKALCSLKPVLREALYATR